MKNIIIFVFIYSEHIKWFPSCIIKLNFKWLISISVFSPLFSETNAVKKASNVSTSPASTKLTNNSIKGENIRNISLSSDSIRSHKNESIPQQQHENILKIKPSLVNDEWLLAVISISFFPTISSKFLVFCHIPFSISDILSRQTHETSHINSNLKPSEKLLIFFQFSLASSHRMFSESPPISQWTFIKLSDSKKSEKSNPTIENWYRPFIIIHNKRDVKRAHSRNCSRWKPPIDFPPTRL